MHTPAHVGIIGCGKICDQYFHGIRKFNDTARVIACADLDIGRARQKAAEYSIARACSPEELIADPEIDIVLNLTIPQAHVPLNLKAIEHGKHPYCEKPFALNHADAKHVLQSAREGGIQTGCAPDTFLGGGIQTCRKLIDEGAIGEPVGAVAFMACPGHESWHPSPEFYYKAGGGPMYDMGPYYLTALVNLLGPARRVAATARKSFETRTITSEPLRGSIITVDVPTHYSGTVEFASGAIATCIMSFDVVSHHLPRLEVYGSEGTIEVPDPNTFKGPVRLKRRNARDWEEIPLSHTDQVGRGIGIAEFANAIRNQRLPRASGELATHVVEVMDAFEKSSTEERHIVIESPVERPLPLDPAGSLDAFP